MSAMGEPGRSGGTGYVYRAVEGASAAAPVLFLFHGTGGDENQFFDLGGQLLPGARLVAPRGDVSEGGMLRYFRRTGEGVYDMPDLARRTDNLAKFVKEQVGEGEHGPVLGFGYSNGANILASVLMRHPHLFDAAALLHPLIPFDPDDVPLSGKKILITAGRRDPIGPAHRTERLANWFQRQQADVRIVWHEGGHELQPLELRAAAEFFRLYDPSL